MNLFLPSIFTSHREITVSQLQLSSGLKPSSHGATQKKLIGHANYQPVTSELLPLEFSGMLNTALPVSNPVFRCNSMEVTH